MIIADTPPAIYNHIPHIKPIIIHSKNIDFVCRFAGGKTKLGSEIYACSGFAKDGTCIIFMPEHVNKKDYGILLRHEYAHCNGWKHGLE